MTIKDAILNHYKDTDLRRSQQQEEREQWLIPNVVPFSRWVLMPAAVIIQLCCGSLYAWSGYNLSIETYIFGPNNGVDRALAVNTFYVAVAVFGCTAAIFGPWLERAGPFKGAMLGASLFFFGQLVTALGLYVKQIAVVYIGYGLFAGAGLGISYIAPVSPLQKWFPEMRGLAAGLAVCGFGGGSIIAPYTQKALIGADYALKEIPNLGVPLTFVILGASYFVLMSLAALTLRMPPHGYEVKGITIETIKGSETVRVSISGSRGSFDKKEDAVVVSMHEVPTYGAKESVESGVRSVAIAIEEGSKEVALSSYFNMTLLECIQSITGLMIISKIQNIVSAQFGKTASEAALINSLLGGANLLGRLAVPLMSDLINSRKTLFVISLFTQAVCLGCIPLSIEMQSYWSFLFEVNVIAFFYGSGFGMIPAFLADQFGSKNIGPTHGIILTAWSLAGVAGGILFTSLYSTNLKATYNAATKIWTPPSAVYHVYDTNFRWILAVTILGFLVSLMVPADLKLRRLPRTEGEVLRMRAFGSIFKYVKGKGIVKVTKEEEAREWDNYLKSLVEQK
ncbi:hypothetical protein HDV05_005235 [Chytridiales sp. JEL 0842]|nr:hypothetical protein HDV05_005235 [Chytridiales sp. JEL 0842]